MFPSGGRTHTPLGYEHFYTLLGSPPTVCAALVFGSSRPTVVNFNHTTKWHSGHHAERERERACAERGGVKPDQRPAALTALVGAGVPCYQLSGGGITAPLVFRRCSQIVFLIYRGPSVPARVPILSSGPFPLFGATLVRTGRAGFWLGLGLSSDIFSLVDTFYDA